MTEVSFLQYDFFHPSTSKRGLFYEHPGWLYLSAMQKRHDDIYGS